jgi:predicted nuclease of predicted toxin-antitoxin system
VTWPTLGSSLASARGLVGHENGWLFDGTERVIRLLLDENISPALVRLLAEIDVYAQSVPHVGLAGRADHTIWQYALDHDFAFVTTNAQDFIALLNAPVHPGLIVLRESGLSRQEQWEWLRPVVEHVKKFGDEDFLLNKLIEITGVGQFKIREIPEP